MNYTVQNIYDDENTESDLISGKKISGAAARSQQAQSQKQTIENEDSENLDLDDLMQEMNEDINLADKNDLKKNSMNHFKFKLRDAV